MMIKFIEGRFERWTRLTICAGMGLGMTACASTGVVKMTEPAPITYKIGNGDAQYASLTLPKSSESIRQRGVASQPDYSRSQPTPYTPQYRAEPKQPLQQPMRSGPQFDPNSVDVQLYSHQKLGQLYTIDGQSHKPEHDPAYDVAGIASWYGEKFHGRPTATGEIFNMNDMTAAHRTLPLNSLLHVENLENGRSLIVRLNDRGPFVDTRIIDLSKGAAQALGTIDGGLARVRVRYIGPADPNASRQAVAPSPALPPISMQEQPQTPTPYSAPLPYQEPTPQRHSEVSPYESALPTLPYENPMPTPDTPQVSMDYFDMPQANPQFEPDYPVADNYGPIAPRSPIPVPGQPAPEHDDSQITLTIKGPIHIAKSDKRDVNQPRFIPAVNSRIYNTLRD